MSFPIFTPESLVAFFAAVWSVLLEYLPGLADWFDGLEFHNKQAVTAAGLLVIVVIATVLSCTGVIQGAIVCTDWQTGVANAVMLLFAALVVNQSTHRITKRES